MVVGKKARPKSPTRRRKLTRAEELQIQILARWKVFRVYELAQIFRVPDKRVREVIRQGDSHFTESGNPLPVSRLSFLLDERYSRALLKVTALATLRDETATPLRLLELGIDLVCWIWGVRAISFPGKMATRSQKRAADCPLPSRFAVLRQLAEWSGRVPDCERIEQELIRTRKKKTWKGEEVERRIRTGYGHWLQRHMIVKTCLYHGIDLQFVRYHYPERGKYLSLGKLKQLVQFSQMEIWQEVKKKIPYKKLPIFFLAHELKIRQKKERYTGKIIENTK